MSEAEQLNGDFLSIDDYSQAKALKWGRTTVNALQLRMYAKNRTVYWA
jgi:hypothetical protein